MTVSPIVGIERRQIQLLNRPEDAPHQVILGQPIQQRRRHQIRLIAIARDEVLGHPRIELTTPDGTPFPDSHGVEEPPRRVRWTLAAWTAPLRLWRPRRRRGRLGPAAAVSSATMAVFESA